MKKFINNKVYDTETAQRVGEWDNGYYTNDFLYCSEDLYKKKTGEFFLHGNGNAMSKYASSIGNNIGSGEKIIPMTYDEAKQWAEDHISADDYITIFGEPEEDDTRAQIHLNLSRTAISTLKKTAQKNGKTVSGFVEDWAQSLRK